MALIREETCRDCGQTKNVEWHSFIRNGRVCPECVQLLADQKRRIFLASLTGLTVEERLAKIEARLYDLQIEMHELFEPKQRLIA